MTTYTVPARPADPEAAALELIVRLPREILRTNAFTATLQDYCGVLHAEGAFASLSWPDAKAVAGPCPSIGAPAMMPPTSCVTGRGRCAPGWMGSRGTTARVRVRALTIAATVLGL
jgi:hypothetical protein